MDVGFRVANRYELSAVVGRGGMGTVYRAWDHTERRTVALKHVVLPTREAAIRFSREVEALATIEIDEVVRYVDHGVRGEVDGWLVLEWLEGHDLSTRLQRGRLSVAEALDVGRRVCRALADIHARGIVHRDVKPANIWLVEGAPAAAKLLDFGVARRAATVRHATALGAALGTPGYMAPEQIRDAGNVDPRMDVFSVGVLLYEMLAGVGPFAASHALATMARVIFDTPTRLDSLRDDVPPGLVDLITSLLAKDSVQRPADAGVVLEALDAPGLCDDRPRAVVVSERERRTMTIVLLQHGDGQRLDATLAASAVDADTALAPAPERAWLPVCREHADVHHAHVVPLGEQGCVILPPNLGYVADTAKSAHRLALALAESLSDQVRLALVTGRAAPGGQLLFGELVAKALENLAAFPDRAIVIDDATALLSRTGSEGTPLLGRGAEMATLSALWAACREEGTPHAALLIGSPGVGKTRLVEALVDAADARVWRARAHTHMQRSPYFAVSQVLRSASEDPATWLARHVSGDDLDLLRSVLGEWTPDEHAPDVVAARRDPRLLRERIGDAWLSLMAAATRDQPRIIILDHVQWLDSPSAALFAQTLAELDDAPLFVVASGRPESEPVLASTWPEQVHRVRVSGLSKKAMHRLAIALGVDEEDAARTAELAAGNPLHLEELARARAAGLTALPDGLLALVEARLDRIPPELRRVVRAASVLTPPFSSLQLAALLGEGTSLDAQIQQLEKRGLLVVRSEGLSLRQDLVRETAYATLPADERRAAHAVAADWLERRGDPDPLVLATHFEHSGQNERAARALREASRVAFDAGDATSTIALLDRALELDEHEAPSVELLRARGLRFQGRMVEARACLAGLRDRLPVDSTEWFLASAEQATALAAVGDRVALGALGRDVHDALAGLTPDSRGPRVGAAAVVVHALLSAGLHDQVDALWPIVEQDLAHQEVGVRAYLHVAGAHRAIAAGRVAECRDEARSAVDAFAICKHRRGKVNAQVVLGYAQLELGLLDAAEATLRAAVATATRGGMAMLAEAARQNLGRTFERLGRLAEAAALLDEVARAFAQQSDARMEGCTRIYLATALSRDGRIERAEAEARAALDVLGEGAHFEPFGQATLARILLAAGRPNEAATLAFEANQTLERERLEDGEAVVRLAWAEAEAAVEGAHALEAAQRAVARLRERAARIPIELEREAFLAAIPEHVATLRLERASAEREAKRDRR